MTNNDFSYIKGDTWVFVFVDGKTYNIDQSHINYNSVLAAIQTNDAERVRRAVDPKEDIKEGIKSAAGTNNVTFDDGVIYYKGERVRNVLADRILEMYKDAYDVTPMVNFFDNLMDNPSRQSIEELYGFLEVNKMPITDDGHFLAFKRVRSDYTDVHSGRFDNSVGAVNSMDRNEVDDVRTRTCSAGLHFCSVEYLKGGFGGFGNPIMILKINPADVVSIPVDYNNSKGRCCRYEVVGEYEGDGTPEENPSACVRTNEGYTLTGNYGATDWVVQTYGSDIWGVVVPFTKDAANRSRFPYYLPISKHDFNLYNSGVSPDVILSGKWRCALTDIPVDDREVAECHPEIDGIAELEGEIYYAVLADIIDAMEADFWDDDQESDVWDDEEEFDVWGDYEALCEAATAHFYDLTKGNRGMCFNRYDAISVGHPYYYSLTFDVVRDRDSVYHKDLFGHAGAGDTIAEHEFDRVANYYFGNHIDPKQALIDTLDVILDRLAREF